MQVEVDRAASSSEARTDHHKALLVCSSGGHLLLLNQLRPWWERQERVWVTFHQADSLSMLAGEKVAWAHYPTTRNLPNLLRNLRVGWRVIRRFRPDIVVSTGAGVAFPVFLVAKLFGVKTVFVEAYARIETPSLTGRLCYPLSDLFLVQWDDQKGFYPRAHVIGRLL